MKNRALLLIIAMLLSWYSLAQDDQDQADVSAEPQPPANDVQDTAAAQAAATEDALQEDEEESPGRFIPSEQISQDLGVSFPVDI